MASIEFNTLQALITAKLMRAQEQIRTRMDNERENASGRTRESIHVRNLETHIQLVGGENAAPMGTLEIGRVGGAVPMGFTDILVKWSKDKGLQFESESERKSFAYLLGRRIAREGTKRHEQRVDIYSTIVKDTQQEIMDEVRKEISKQVVQGIGDIFAKTAKTHKVY